MITSRRSPFGFGAALIAAPAIVRVASIMPVSVPRRMTFLEICIASIKDCGEANWSSVLYVQLTVDPRTRKICEWASA